MAMAMVMAKKKKKNEFLCAIHMFFDEIDKFIDNNDPKQMVLKKKKKKEVQLYYIKNLKDIIAYMTLWNISYKRCIRHVHRKIFLEQHEYHLLTCKLYIQSLSMLYLDDDDDKKIQSPIAGLWLFNYPKQSIYLHNKKSKEIIYVRLVTLNGWQVSWKKDTLLEIKTTNKYSSSSQLLSEPIVTMFDSNGIARITGIKVGGGLRNGYWQFSISFASIKTTHIKYGVSSREEDIHSKPSVRSYVITCMNQWYLCKYHILKEALFFSNDNDEPPPPPIHWMSFLELLWMEIRQVKSSILRRAPLHIELSAFDLRCLIEWIYEDIWRPLCLPCYNVINKQMFDVFWIKFGTIFNKIIYNRLIQKLWTHGLIVGFVTRSMAEQILCTRPKGYFIIRFATDNKNFFPFKLVISYRNYTEEFQHVLIEANNLFLNIIKTKPYLTHLLALQFMKDKRRRVIRFYAKHDILEVVNYSKKEIIDQRSGYELDFS